MKPNPFENLSGKRVFVTGHTGFKGSWLVKWLAKLGTSVRGFALAPESSPNHFLVGSVEEDLEKHVVGDVRDLKHLTSEIDEFDPHLIIHFAAQSIVSRGYSDPVETISTNVMGTTHVLESVRLRKRECAVLVITSDKCYENVEQVWGYRESDAMGEKDPYGGSKGAAELIIRSYRSSFFPTRAIESHKVWLASARAGNVIGGGDWTENALLVDVFKSLSQNNPVELRSPKANRPWQHVLQCLSGYLTIADQLLGQKTTRVCDSFNIGPMPGNEWTVENVVEHYIQFWGSGSWIGPDSPSTMGESSILRLAIDKAIWELNWRPIWDVSKSIEETVRWYQAFLESPTTINETTHQQIEAFQNEMLVDEFSPCLTSGVDS